LDSKQVAVVEYTDAMMKKVEVPEGVFERIEEFFEERGIGGTVTIVAANAVNRFVVVPGVGGKRKRNRSA
jgi:4-carboxymuconolactone decarboxylase